jgi:hypothetical protein
VLNVSRTYTVKTANITLRPGLLVDNLFDVTNGLMGAFFSGAPFGRPRTFSLRLVVGV